MRKLWYVPLESYSSRYTLQLRGWNEHEFKKDGIDYECIEGAKLTQDETIVTGQVLDAHGRSYFALSQIMIIIRLLKQGEMGSDDVLFFEDMFHPGIESLPYIFDQTEGKYKPKVFVRCLAQTIDPDDFVHVWNMDRWMRPYEQMVDKFVDGILIASEEMAAHIKIAGWTSNLYVTGLPFGKQEVQSRVTQTNIATKRPNRVVFASRWDQEKQPHFFMDLCIKINKQESLYKRPLTEFCVVQGTDLRSNDPSLVTRAFNLNRDPNVNFKIYTNLTKNEYYSILADSKILFNCALQDWVSNTISEADALGCMVLFPAYRSFPEACGNNSAVMYIPWSLEDAAEKLCAMLRLTSQASLDTIYKIGNISDYQNKTIARTLKAFKGLGDEYRRSSKRYRNNVGRTKF